MGRNRYRDDYDLSESTDGKGRIHTSVRYKGDPFCFEGDLDRIRKLKSILPVLAAVSWLFWLGGMSLHSGAMRFLPAALPYVFCALPLALFTECCFAFRGMKEPLENRHADRMNNRYPPTALALAFLPGVSFAAAAVGCVRKGLELPGDLWFLVCSALLCGIGLYAFRVRRDLRVCRKEKL